MNQHLPPLPRHRCDNPRPHLQHIERDQAEPEFLCDGVPGLTQEEALAQLEQRYRETHPEEEPMDSRQFVNDAMVEEQNRLQETVGAPPASEDSAETPAAPETAAQPLSEAEKQERLQRIQSQQGQPPNDLVVGIERAVAAALYRHGQDERVDYACSMGVVGNEQGQMQPVVAIFVAIPGLVLGEKVHGTQLLTNLFASGEAIDGLIHQMLETLRTSRYEQAQQATANHNPHLG